MSENRTILRHPPGQGPILTSGRRRLPGKGVEKSECRTTPAPPFPVRPEGGANPDRNRRPMTTRSLRNRRPDRRPGWIHLVCLRPGRSWIGRPCWASPDRRRREGHRRYPASGEIDPSSPMPGRTWRGPAGREDRGLIRWQNDAHDRFFGSGRHDSSIPGGKTRRNVRTGVVPVSRPRYPRSWPDRR
jgi:hypothetical protein